jgi:hypothetical protein
LKIQPWRVKKKPKRKTLAMIKPQTGGSSFFLPPVKLAIPAHLASFMKSSRSAYTSQRFTSVAATSISQNNHTSRGKDMFAEGQWQMIKAMLERQGWSQSHLELMRQQLRQGWPLSIAKQNVSALIGYCPIRSRAMA